MDKRSWVFTNDQNKNFLTEGKPKKYFPKSDTLKIPSQNRFIQQTLSARMIIMRTVLTEAPGK